MRPLALLSLAALCVLTACKDMGSGADAPTGGGKPAVHAGDVAGGDKTPDKTPDKPADPAQDAATDRAPKPADPPMPVILPAEKKSDPPPPKGEGEFVACPPESRGAQVCTRDYRPVCGRTATDERKTFANKCTACTEATITGYVVGACPKTEAPRGP